MALEARERAQAAERQRAEQERMRASHGKRSRLTFIDRQRTHGGLHSLLLLFLERLRPRSGTHRGAAA